MRTNHSPKPENREVPAVLMRLLESVDVRFNGDRSWDIQVHDPALYDRILRQGSLGFGESYMDNAWDSECLDETLHKLLSACLNVKIKGFGKLQFFRGISAQFSYQPSITQTRFPGRGTPHDIGNDVYAAMLDPTMSYSCGYWKDAADLEQAQLAKLRLICDKLELNPGERLLDIGCGWAS